MSIQLDCACGKSYRLKRDLPPGKKIPCPACKREMQAPAPIIEPAETEEDPFAALMAGAHDEPEAPPARSYQAPPTLPPLPQQPAAWTPPTGTTYAQMARNAPPQKQKAAPRVTFEQGWFGSVNSGAVGGLLMMVIAIVWFVAGLAADRIFFYPPVLLVIGLISTVKGVLGGND